ncbi:MAG TPA: thymidylate synthase [Methanosarcinales archaeon]|nr:thymidylate synthase [Methanosarcinales archaeon]
MNQYIDIVKEVLTGDWKENRTGIKTRMIHGLQFKHFMPNGFPLLTTKKMAWRTCFTELEGFIGGITSKQWYKDRKCNIWNEWCNPQLALAIRHPELEDDLGPIYGYQWRRFNRPYRLGFPITSKFRPRPLSQSDQLAIIVHHLEYNRTSRRMVCSAWNPLQLDQMALPPCIYSFTVTTCAGYLNLEWTQRSVDVMIGLPFDIASHAMLLRLLAEEARLQPGWLTGSLQDTHIYENHIDAAKEQIERKPRELPTVQPGGPMEAWNMFEWEAAHVVVNNYDPYPKIKLEVAV